MNEQMKRVSTHECFAVLVFHEGCLEPCQHDPLKTRDEALDVLARLKLAHPDRHYEVRPCFRYAH